MSPVTAVLGPPEESRAWWRWEVSTGGAPPVTVIPLAADPRRLVARLGEIDRFHRHSSHNVAVYGRGAIVERFLDRVWHELMRPLVAELPGPVELRLEIPPDLIRLPLTTARHAGSGESLIHLCEPVVEWRPGRNQSGRTGGGRAEGVTIRVDGHLADVAGALRRRPPARGSILLLLGCRTAKLLPWLPEIGSSLALVTSWDVDDRQCGALGDLVEGGLATGLTLAAAARSAQAQLSGRHPYEWAGYSVVEVVGATLATP